MALNSAAVGRLSQTWEVSIKGGWIDAIQFHPRLPLHDKGSPKISAARNHHELAISLPSRRIEIHYNSQEVRDKQREIKVTAYIASLFC